MTAYTVRDYSHAPRAVRLAFLREAIDSHFGADPKTLRPLAGHSALDVGCGAGLLAAGEEPPGTGEAARAGLAALAMFSASSCMRLS